MTAARDMEAFAGVAPARGPYGSRRRGRTVGNRYALLERIGGHPGAWTFLARDRRTSTACVVKELIPEDGGQGSLARRFESEARALAGIRHPRIPRLLDHFGEDVRGELRLYTVEEHVTGTSLADCAPGPRRERTRPVSPAAWVVSMLRQGLEILSFLHDRTPAVVHGCVDAGHLFVDARGRLHLVGLRPLRDGLGETATRVDVHGLGAAVRACLGPVGSVIEGDEPGGRPGPASSRLPDGLLGMLDRVAGDEGPTLPAPELLHLVNEMDGRARGGATSPRRRASPGVIAATLWAAAALVPVPR